MSDRLEVAWSISVAILLVTSMIIVGSVALAASVTAQSGSAPQVTDTGADQPRTTPEDTPLTITGISVADADDGVTDANDDGNPDAVVMEAQFAVSGGTVALANTDAGVISGTDGTDAVTINGTVAEINDALDGMSFTPEADQNSQVSGYDPDIDITFTDTTNSDSTSYTVDNLAVSAVNDAPAVDQSNATGLTVDEGGSASFAAPTSSGQGFTQDELGLTEIDNNAEQTVIKVASLPGQGSLIFNGNPVTTGSTLAAENLDNLAYVHDGSQVTSPATDTFELTYDDGAGGLLTDQPVTVNLEPVNQPPSVGGSVTIIEGETDVRLDNNGNLPTLGDPRGAINTTDPEGESITEYTIDSLPTEGTLKLNGNPVGAGDVVTDITQLTYSHDGSEPAPDSFDVSVTDNGGAGTPKTASGTVTLDIHPNNDDPTLTTNEEQTLSSGSSLTLTSAMLGLTDPDTPDDALTYTVTDVPDPADGYFEVDGQTLQAGATFTQADIDANRVQYVTKNAPPTGDTRADSFSFTVQDGDFRILPDVREGGIYDTDAQNSPLTENTFTVSVTDSVTPDPDPVPADAPTNTPPTPGGSNTAALLEGETVPLTSSMLDASDDEQSPGELVYRLESLPASGDIRLNGDRLRVGQSFTQADIDDGNVAFAHGGGEDFVDSFDYTVSDGQATSDVQTFDLDVTPQNDSPSAETDTTFVKEEESVTLTRANIALSDPDNSDSDDETGFAADQDLRFTIDSLPGNGMLTLGGTAVTAGDTVTQAQLNNGELEYTHDGTENFADDFAISPVDDAGVGSGDATATNAGSTGAQANVPIVIYPVNDAPSYVSKTDLTSSGAGPVLEGDTVSIGGASSYDTINGVTGSGEPTPASGAHLSFGDNDSSSTQRQYRITAAPAHGQLLLNGNPVGVGSSFTQGDLDNGNIQYEHDGTEGADYGNEDSFDYIVSDGDWQANDNQIFAQGTSATPSTYNIDIAQRNDVPELDAPDSLDAFASDDGTTPIPTITVDDLDLDDGIQPGETDFIRVELSVLDNDDTPVTAAELDYTDGTPSYVSGENSNSLIVQGTKAEIDDVLSSLTVAFSADENADDYTIRVTADDRLYDSSGSLDGSGDANGGPAPDNADGTPISAANNRVTQDIALRASNDNDEPTITNGNTYSVNEDSQVTLDGFTLTDADSFGEDITATVELYTDSGRTTLADADTQGSLRLGDTTGLTTSSGDDSNTITLTGSISDVEAALNDLRFEGAPDYNGPGQGIGGLYLRTTFEDFAHADGQKTDQVDNVIEITPVNDRPTLDVPADQTLDSGTSIAISGFSVADTADTDQGADDFITVEVAATQGGNPYGTIELTSSGGATVTDSGTATVTVSGTAADVQDTLDSMDYAPDDLNVDETILMTVTADDRDPAGDGNGGEGNGKEGVGVDGNNTVQDTFNIDVSDVNEMPSVNDPSSQSVDEDASLTFSSGNSNAFSVSDPDDFGADMEATVSVDHGTVAAASSGATLAGDDTASLTITGTESEINAALDGLVYTPGPDFHTDGTADPDTITVTIDDQGNTGSGGALSASQSATIDITPVNDRPVASGGPETVTETVEHQTGSPKTLSSLLSGNYDDSTDDQTADGGGDTSTVLSFVAITGLTDYDPAQGTWQVSDGSGGWIDVPASGLDASTALVVDANREIRFDPAPDFHGTPGTLDVRLADNSADLSSEVSTGAGDRKDLSNVGGTGETGSWSADSVTIQTSVTNENDPPSATGDVTLPSVNEDNADPAGERVADLFDGVFDDSTDDQTGIGGDDASTSLGGIAIVGSAAEAGTEGTWQYSTDSGGSWDDIPQGAADDTSAIILPDDAELRFVPVGDYNGAPGDLNVRLADATQSFSGSSDISAEVGDDPNRNTDIWSGVTNLDTSVTPVNDAPSASPSQNFDIDEDDGAQTVTSFMESVEEGGGDDEDSQIVTFDIDSVGDGTTYTAAQLFDTLPTFTDATDGSDGSAGSATPNTLAFEASDILAAGESETVTVTVGVTDDGGTSNGGDDTGTDQSFTITINGENDRPTLDTALPDQTNVDGETITPVDVSDSFSDVDASDTLTYSASNLPPGLTIDPNTGVISGTIGDSASQSGPYSVTITADDGSGTATATQTDTFDWTVTNPAPTATDNTGAVTDDDSPTTTGNVIDDDDGNGVDSDPDDPASQLEVSAVDGNAGGVDSAVTGSHGEVTIGSDGGYTYNLDSGSTAVQELAAGETLTDTFDYTLSDREGGTDTATLTVTVNGANDAPLADSIGDVADDDGAAITVDAGDAFTDPEGDDLSYTATGLPDGVTIDSDNGTIGGELPADASQEGPYEVTVTADDGNGGTTDQTFTITASNVAPIAADDTNTTSENAATSGNVVTGPGTDSDGGNDTDDLSVAQVDGDGANVGNATAGDNGGTFTINADGSYDFDPGTDFDDLAVGESRDTAITYQVSDGQGGTDTATLTVTVNGANDAPVADDDSFTTAEDSTSGPIDLLGNDTDPDGDTLSVESIAGTTLTPGSPQTIAVPNGTVNVSDTGEVTFTPDADYNGPVSFEYTVSDGNGGTDTGTVTGDVTADYTGDSGDGGDDGTGGSATMATPTTTSTPSPTTTATPTTTSTPSPTTAATPTTAPTPSPTPTATTTPTPNGTTTTPDANSHKSCELFGLDYGSFIICWYWWLLIPIVGLSLVVYQIWHRGMLGQLLGMKTDDIGGENDE